MSFAIQFHIHGIVNLNRELQGEMGMSVRRHIADVEKFYTIIGTITSGVRDVVQVNRWKTLYNKLCDQMGLLVFEFRTRYGMIQRFICKNQEAYDKVKKSKFVRDRIVGNLTAEGRIELGEILSLPPASVRAFAYKLYAESTQIKVEYQGLKFTSFEETIADDMAWLIENVKPRIKKG